ncbi:hypothetical protein RI543_000951 [Arxiozyma heterogenica]|uniref:mRNA decay factor PAT1 domain-containing protein n=1 Tax=Arxiozyma heterogenica TaxID=278026 RepID=A0AAN7WNZ8_9SACH|nr:hypothetical protein RI543_000951 [Kazachstania heterogenica]
MSFFGFDTTLPSHNKAQQNAHSSVTSNDNNNEILDFDDTYKGYGEYEEEEGDYLNAETFGGDVEIGTDFDFGHSNQSEPIVNTNRKSYVQAATSGFGNGSNKQTLPNTGSIATVNLDVSVDLKPMESLWGGSDASFTGATTNAATNTTTNAATNTTTNAPHVLSMEEIERQQRQFQQFNNGHPPHQGPPYMPPQGFMPPPQLPPQQQNQNAGQFNQPAFVPQLYPNMYHPNQYYQQPLAQNPQSHQQQQHHLSMPPPINVNPISLSSPNEQQQQSVVSASIPTNVTSSSTPTNSATISTSTAIPLSSPMLETDLHKTPLSHTASPMVSDHPELNMSVNAIPTPPIHAPVMVSSHSPAPTHQQQPPQQQQQQQQQSQGRSSQRREPLTPEEQKRLQIRHAKVEKILRHAGLMTPRDKDFITRYQLSQIVSDDPYNEDFYFQVYKIIQRGGVVGESNKGLIARAYLEHSGHRLGGRYKRADIALQRMQSQVEKAVTVAKERPQKKNDDSLNSGNGSGRDGVLGKVSTSLNSKAPRRQLTLPLTTSRSGSNLADEDINSPGQLRRNSSIGGALQEVTESLDNVDLNAKTRARRRSSYALSSIDQNFVLTRSGGRKFVLSLIESVYKEVLELEANLRSGKEINNKELWSALHVDDEFYEVSPFISMLSFDKGVKIMPRIFNFLDKEQKLKLLQTFFSELSHLNIIIISSYRTNPEPNESQLKKIDLFQTVFLKIIVSFLSNSSNFIEIMSLLLHLIKNNNVAFISTSKIGLNLITVLISRAALIRQDSNRSSVLSTPEISTWNEIYDKLFTALESKISNIFPPKEYIDKINQLSSQSANDNNNTNHTNINNKNNNSQSSPMTHYYDQAYIWQFLASLALSGKLNHQRIIIDEVRDEIFGTINQAELLKEQLQQKLAMDGNQNTAVSDEIMYRREKLYQDLNLFLNVMGLVSRDGEITELK